MVSIEIEIQAKENHVIFLELAFLKASSHYSTKGSCESSVKR